jgi:hypothetical protein
MDRRSIGLTRTLALASSLMLTGCGLLPSTRQVPPEPAYSTHGAVAPPREVGFGSSPHPSNAPLSSASGPPRNPYALDGAGPAASSAGNLDVTTLGAPAVDAGGSNGGTLPQ